MWMQDVDGAPLWPTDKHRQDLFSGTSKVAPERDEYACFWQREMEKGRI